MAQETLTTTSNGNISYVARRLIRSHSNSSVAGTPSSGTNLTDLPPEVLGPLLLRALPLAPSCSPDLIARPCRAALAHLSAQQVAQWLLDSKGAGGLHAPLRSLAGSCRADREAMAEQLLRNCSCPWALLGYMRDIASVGSIWLFRLLLHKLPHDDQVVRVAVEVAAASSPGPAAKLALLQTLPWQIGSREFWTLGLGVHAGWAASQGDAVTCRGLLQLCPAEHRTGEVINCLRQAAYYSRYSALSVIVAAMPDNMDIDGGLTAELAYLVRKVLDKGGPESGMQQLLAPLVSKLNHEAKVELVQAVLAYPSVGGNTAVATRVLGVLPPLARMYVLRRVARAASTCGLLMTSTTLYTIAAGEGQ